MSMNKESKLELGLAIQQFYIEVMEFNKIAGRTLHESEYANQLKTVVEEAQELQTGLDTNDIVEVVDAVIDSMFTASYAVAILDGNDSITKNAPLYLNPKETPVEVLIPEALVYLEGGNMIDFLTCCEDMCVTLRADMPYCLKQVSSSNLSKYLLVKDIPDVDLVCEMIEDQGRYENVTFSVSSKFNEPCYVFMATVDKKNNTNFPNGKVVKPPKEFGYFDPSLVIYE